MHYQPFLYFALLGSSTAQSIPTRHARGLHPRDVSNLAALATLATIKTSLKHGTEGVTAVDAAFKAITAENVKTQLVTVNNALTKLSSDVTGDTKKMKSSGAITISEILGLVSEAPRNELLGAISGLFTAMNKTAATVVEKRDIIKNSGSVDIIVPGIKAQRQGLVDIVSIVPSQVPAIAKGPIDNLISGFMSKASTPPAGSAPAVMRRQSKGAPKGGKGGAPGGAPKGSSGGSSSSGSGGGALERLLSSPEALENIGKGIDAGLDRIIAWLKGDVDTLFPPEMLDQLGKAMAKAPKAGSPAPKAGP
jgi:uncharacterized membrane protein YgcG